MNFSPNDEVIRTPRISLVFKGLGTTSSRALPHDIRSDNWIKDGTCLTLFSVQSFWGFWLEGNFDMVSISVSCTTCTTVCSFYLYSRRYPSTTQQKLLCRSATIMYRPHSFLYKQPHFKIPKSQEFQSNFCQIHVCKHKSVSWSSKRICCGQVQQFHCTSMKHFIVVDLHDTKCCILL